MLSRTLTILGSTGSIGTNTLDVVRQNREHFHVFALAAGRNVELLAQQIQEFSPEVAVLEDAAGVERLRALITDSGISGKSRNTELLWGPEALVKISTAAEADTVMSSIVGVAGLEATYEAICRGKRVGLANKEVLVSGGKLVMDAVKRHGTEMIPVDSEHNGAHQCLRAGLRNEATKLILTASGGPFRRATKESLEWVTPADALKHPTWKMGNRITIDSATLMNKGFEVIEACWLFDFSPADVEVVVHPQSTVHAMVEYNDGSVVAQVCATDMRMPIQYALTWPERWRAPVPVIDWSESRQWEFHAPDRDKFPLLDLAYQAQTDGGSATCVLNAADEIAVEAFLQGRIGFTAIARVVKETLERIPYREPSTIREILDIDEAARGVARDVIAKGSVAFAPVVRGSKA
ncbi:MAG TPA: 1-deoxy-D-xylulose-5-phosphate reductoisomerase [Bryobacteraceae bacterium]|jgi:1-deoxy-D-xylulose-5-phosphate reductoisomerase|nr:1-deoxy-D-xylulose-5-phosphate reductoisomerase [Bryobacteraceae bacterium]